MGHRPLRRGELAGELDLGEAGLTAKVRDGLASRASCGGNDRW